MRSRPDAADSSICAILRSVYRICSAIGPRLRPPPTGSTGPSPDRKIYLATRMPGECGRLALRETLSLGFTGSITLRSTPSVIGPPRCSSQRNAFDLDLLSANEPGAADGPRRRIDREELAIDRVHVFVFQHRIDQRIDLDHLGERAAGGFQQMAHVG